MSRLSRRRSSRLWRGVCPSGGAPRSAFGLSLLLFSLILVPAQARAQTTLSREIQAHIVNELEPGDHVRGADAFRIEGTFLAIEGEEVLVSRDAGVQHVPVERIEGLWVRKSGIGRGALLGGVIGAIVGAGLGIVVGEVLCNDDDCEANTLEAVGILGAAGAGLGIAGGALVGSFVKSWRLVWP